MVEQQQQQKTGTKKRWCEKDDDRKTQCENKQKFPSSKTHENYLNEKLM